MKVFSRWAVCFVALVSSLSFGATITVDTRDFSVPAGRVTLQLSNTAFQGVLPIGANRTFFNNAASYALADGTYVLSFYATTIEYGRFTVSGGEVSTVAGALRIVSPTQVAAEPSSLTEVAVDSAVLSNPTGAVTARLTVVGSTLSAVAVQSGAAPVRYFLPDALYRVTTYSTRAMFGEFRIQTGVIGSPTGATTVTGSTVSFDRQVLAPVRFRTTALTSSPSLNALVSLVDGDGVAVLQRNDPIVYLPDGSYTLRTLGALSTFGSLEVTNRALSTASGNLIRSGDEVLFDLPRMTAVQVGLSTLTTPAFNFLLRLSHGTQGYVSGAVDGTVYLPDGTFEVTEGSTTRRFGTLTTNGGAVSLTGGLDISGGVLTGKRCGLAVVDLFSPSLARVDPYGRFLVTGAQRVSLPVGTYTFVSSTNAVLANIDVSPTLGVTATNVATGVRVTPVPCVVDEDGDGREDPVDNCPSIPNPTQADLDGDGQGDACDADDDGDGVQDGADNCPAASNADQVDQDLDGVGNACDSDLDGDGVLNAADRCPLIADDQADLDGDGAGDACDDDFDGDNVPDATDNCLGLANVDQLDADHDGQGNDCDVDDDGDSVADADDNCALVSNPSQANFDGDTSGDACDSDGDGDGVANGADVCPATSPGVAIDGVGCGGIEGVALRCAAATFQNHGRFVSCVARESAAAVAAGLLTDVERARLVAQAARKP